MAYLGVTGRRSAPRTTSIFHGGRGRPTPLTGAGIPGLGSTDKKNIMRTIAKLAHLGTSGGLAPLSEIVGSLRRALAAAVLAPRPVRPLRDIDNWSDQAEIAYYESCRTARCL